MGGDCIAVVSQLKRFTEKFAIRGCLVGIQIPRPSSHVPTSLCQTNEPMKSKLSHRKSCKFVLETYRDNPNLFLAAHLMLVW